MSSLEEFKQLCLDYRTTFETEGGKRVLGHLRKKCYGSKSTFNLDERQHAFNEGGRAVLLDIEIMLSKDLEKLEQQEGTQND